MNPTRIIDAIAYRQAEMKGVSESFVAIFGRPEAADLPEVPDDPSLLGALFEGARRADRASSFSKLISGGGRHDGKLAVSTTQRFTPPWLARWLVAEGARACSGDPWPSIDPACGGGQLLLALYDKLSGLGRAPHEILSEDLVGYDIDPRAARVAALSLWLRAAADAGPAACELPHPRVLSPAPGGGLAETGALGAWEQLVKETDGLVAPGRFAVVLANPPYMGARHLTQALRRWLREAYGPFSGDLYTAFMARCVELARPRGGVSILCQHSFLFLKRDRELRRQLMSRVSLREVLHLGPHAFETISGEKAAVVAFSATVGGEPTPARFVDLTRTRRACDKRAEWETIRSRGFQDPRVYQQLTAVQRASEGKPLTYWWPEVVDAHLDAPDRLEDFVEIPGAPNKTADNRRFVRYWWEIAPADLRSEHWLPYAKGGPHRKWIGNLERVIDWTPAARGYYRTNPTSNLLAERYWPRQGLTWSDFGGRAFSARLLPAKALFDMAGPALFAPQGGPSIHFWLALLNAPYVCHLLNASNATIHYQVSNLRRLPLPPRDVLLAPSSVDLLERLAGQAETAAARFDSWSLTSAAFERPLLLEAHAEISATNLEALVEGALGVWDATDRALCSAESRIGGEVEAMYAAPREVVAALDRRDPLPLRVRPKRRVLLETAAVHVQEIAEGFREHPGGAAPGGFGSVGSQLYGNSIWNELIAELGGQGSALARVRTRRLALYKRRPWHPDRRRPLLNHDAGAHCR